MNRLRLLFISHSHPHLRNGGAEIAAYRLFEAFAETGTTQAWFLGCGSAQGRSGAVITQPAAREYLYHPAAFDWFKLANRDPRFPAAFAALLRDLRPDVVHFHHVAHIGVEALHIVQRVLPAARVVLTLHEYLPICHHFGQMVTPARALCQAATPARCAGCFPQHDAADFFLRARYIRRHLDLADRLVAPSVFLARRFADWGLPASRMTVIENAVAAAKPQGAEATLAPTGRKPPGLRIGFFGQISWLKGCNVLLDAAARLQNDAILFDIHGDPSGQPPDFQKEFQERLGRAGPNVRFHGAYRNDDVDRLMQGVDAVLVPSVWWENSPVVIQEALRNRRPVICSNIGGMAEKVRHGQDGFHFPANDAPALAALLRRLSGEPRVLRSMRAGMAQPAAIGQISARHHRLYRLLLDAPALSDAAD